MTTAVFVQARMGSTRLPGKALLELAGRPVIAHVLTALLEIPADMHVLLCDSQSEEAFTDIAASHGFILFTGHPTDVLRRYCDAIRQFQPDTVIRATGDNPLVSSTAARMILAKHIRANADYTRFSGLPTGSGVEVAQSRALLEAEMSSDDPYDREHVTPFIYRNPDRFSVTIVPAPARLTGSITVTLDTSADYQFLSRLFDRLYDGAPIPIERIIQDGIANG